MTEEERKPAGWYDDGTGRQRWWDGTEWGAYAEGAQVPDTESEEVSHDAEVDEAQVPVAVEPAETVIIQRTRRAPFNPPPAEQGAEESGVTVSRSWGLGLRSANGKKDSGLTRNRKIAGELPDWAPLPPGELSVGRAAGKRS